MTVMPLAYPAENTVEEHHPNHPLPLLAKEGSSENRGCLFVFYPQVSGLSKTAIADSKQDQTVTSPLLCKEG
jgi:hypothetical protein